LYSKKPQEQKPEQYVIENVKLNERAVPKQKVLKPQVEKYMQVMRLALDKIEQESEEDKKDLGVEQIDEEIVEVLDEVESGVGLGEAEVGGGDEVEDVADDEQEEEVDVEVDVEADVEVVGVVEEFRLPVLELPKVLESIVKVN